MRKKRREIGEMKMKRLNRTPREQVALLNTRPGFAIKERKRLQAMIDAGNGNTRGVGQYKVEDDQTNQN